MTENQTLTNLHLELTELRFKLDQMRDLAAVNIDRLIIAKQALQFYAQPPLCFDQGEQARAALNAIQTV